MAQWSLDDVYILKYYIIGNYIIFPTKRDDVP